MRTHKGFTLIELVVVVAIIATLLSMVLIFTQNVRSRGRDSQREHVIKQLQTALSLYQLNSSQFPMCDPEEIIDNLPTNCLRPLVDAGTIPVLPIDPLNKGLCGVGFVYCYFSANGFDYTISYSLETDTISGKPPGPQEATP